VHTEQQASVMVNLEATLSGIFLTRLTQLFPIVAAMLGSNIHGYEVEQWSNKQQESGQGLQREGLSVKNWLGHLALAFSWTHILTR